MIETTLDLKIQKDQKRYIDRDSDTIKSLKKILQALKSPGLEKNE